MPSGTRKPVAPYYAVAVLWLLGGALLPLYNRTCHLLLAIVSVTVFYLVNALCKSAGAVEPPAADNPAPAENAELENMLQDGRLALEEMKRLDEHIAHPGISADIVRLSQVSQKIFQAVKDDPSRLSQICRFMDYYLPTTLKLLKSYERMSAAGVAGENIRGTLAKVEDTMHTIVRAFEKQLDGLYGNEALDIAADIQVMETLLAQEGLREDSPPPEGTDIRLEL